MIVTIRDAYEEKQSIFKIESNNKMASVFTALAKLCETDDSYENSLDDLENALDISIGIFKEDEIKKLG